MLNFSREESSRVWESKISDIEHSWRKGGWKGLGQSVIAQSVVRRDIVHVHLVTRGITGIVQRGQRSFVCMGDAVIKRRSPSFQSFHAKPNRYLLAVIGNCLTARRAYNWPVILATAFLPTRQHRASFINYCRECALRYKRVNPIVEFPWAVFAISSFTFWLY